MKLDANSFLFTDDNTGIVYLVRKKGTTRLRRDRQNRDVPAVRTRVTRTTSSKPVFRYLLLAARPFAAILNVRLTC